MLPEEVDVLDQTSEEPQPRRRFEVVSVNDAVDVL